MKQNFSILLDSPHMMLFVLMDLFCRFVSSYSLIPNWIFSELATSLSTNVIFNIFFSDLLKLSYALYTKIWRQWFTLFEELIFNTMCQNIKSELLSMVNKTLCGKSSPNENYSDKTKKQMYFHQLLISECECHSINLLLYRR